MGKKLVDITGNRYGRLLVQKEALPRTKPAKWVVICDCGTIKEVSGKDMKNGKIQSCGCYKSECTKERHTTHGGTSGGVSRLYRIWLGMLQRVTNPKRDSYKSYIGKGITICDSWKDFATFQKWALHNGYKHDLSIDRINNDMSYCPENCRWVNHTMQARNRRSREGSSSKFVGVSKTHSNKWVARIFVNGKSIYLGLFDTEELAAIARDEYVLTNNLENFTLNIVKTLSKCKQANQYIQEGRLVV
jgi:hypothetical protein